MHQTGYPDWDAAMARDDHAKLNAIIGRDAQGATRDLQRACGGGGSQGIKGVKKFDRWFDGFTGHVLDIQHANQLYPATSDSVLSCCAAILALEDVPHWDHLENIKAIRSLLHPDQDWADWPDDEEGGDDEPT